MIRLEYERMRDGNETTRSGMSNMLALVSLMSGAVDCGGWIELD